MKKFLLSISSLILSFAGFSQSLCPTQFLRNNGNNGTCASHIRLYFGACPASVPSLDSIKINGILQPETYSIIDQVCHGNNIYVDYCVSDNNLPPAGQITIYLTYPGNGGSGTISTICNVPEAGPTPVILDAFTAQRDVKNDVDLMWKTEQEINSSSFEIERGYNNGSFEKIGTIAAAGNSSLAKSYTFTDHLNNSKKTSFYRIKMIDKDGSFVYTETKSVKGSSVATSDFLIYPNPGSSNSKITISQLTGPSVIKLFDLSGRAIKTISVENSYSTDITGLQKGTYFVQITDKASGTTQVKKMSIIN